MTNIANPTIADLPLFYLATGLDSPRARKTDPPTSHAAADSNRLDSRAQVLAILRMCGPLADHELVDQFDLYAARMGIRFTPQRLRTARAELTRDGLVEYTGIDRLTPTGRRAQVWAVTS